MVRPEILVVDLISKDEVGGLQHGSGDRDDGIGLFEAIMSDAGPTSLKNVEYINGKDLGYIFRFKGNQPELKAEACPAQPDTPKHVFAL